MTFWMIIFLLVVLAVAGLVIPLLRQPKTQQDSERNAQNIRIAREQLAELERMNAAGELDATEYQASKDELEKALLIDLQQDNTPASRKTISPQMTAIVTGLFVPIAAFALYGWLGTPEALQSTAQQAQELPPDHPPMTGGMQQAPDINKMVEGLRKKLEANPNNPDGWNMLGRSYMNMERFTEAADAYRKLYELQPEDAGVMLLLADALAMSNDGKVTDEGEQLALKALAKEPENVTALWLAGLGASEKGDKAKALEHWKKLLPMLDDSPEEQAEVQGLIQQIEKAPE
ncbi:c-type cytochrome biogenesis protein CcmI [Thiothrix nivea]|uniref:Cytochrome c-type biogenesis protein CcmI n=1 Tax=Thiothrix nivea (strain ATCC 35100 / DSM 5205 / JP2) TaxID=870187 RepID=A0A656HEF2_THINJ|nr:c-type cytochrome biogenesis protein CcmI [Thiothrix nivea]EIJ33846.1 cytochrome c-type biogenesis protein CcmI [Thiothrix nivea DSM 5205]